MAPILDLFGGSLKMNKSLEILLEVLMWIVSLEEFNHENVLLLLIQRVLHVVKEFGNTDVVVLQELDDVHALTVLSFALSHVGVLLQEFCH